MTELLTAAQTRAIEQAAITSGEVTGLELMERAGRGVVEAILEWRPELAKTPHRAVVLCGPGNNGGDGFVLARLLKQRGWEVEVYLYGDEAKLPPDAAENARRWREMGDVKVPPSKRRMFESADLIIDALFGTGLARGLSGDAAAVAQLLFELPYEIDDVPHLQDRVVAIDLPSGLCSDSGVWLGDISHFRAGLTVTFHTPKPGQFLFLGSNICRRLSVVDIGLGPKESLADLRLTDQDEILLYPKDAEDHKYHHGHALILSGGVGKGGAARLTARGALRIGAGLVTVGTPPSALQENAARLDAVMLASIKGVDELQTELRDRKIKAVCIGPGFGTGERLREFSSVLLGQSGQSNQSKTPIAVVLDADALTEFRGDPETLFAMLHSNCVLTPHEGEFGRLFPDFLAKLKEPAKTGPAYSKVDATREAAARAGCVVLFKGPDTVIAAPDGQCAINSAHYERAAPWLATAGSGDVLAGFITGLLARGLEPFEAAQSAAWLHVECARKFGPGLIAEDLPEQLPAVFRDLGL